MAENIIMFSKRLKLFIFIILILNQITNAFGLDYPGDIYCQPLTSSPSTNFKCKFEAKPIRDCQNPENGTTVLISCNPSYEEPSLEINPIRLCQNGKWSSTIPQCYPSNRGVFSAAYDPSQSDQFTYQRIYCPPLTASLSTNFKCKFDAKLTKDCQNPENGTTVLISCNPSCEEPSLEINPIRLCQNGKWSSTIPRCYPSNREVFSADYDPSLSDQTTHQRSCPPLTSSLSTKLTCIYNDHLLNNCENATTGTILVISCNPSYEEPSLLNNPLRKCQDGNWSSSIPQCHSSRVLDSCPSLTSSLSTKLTCIYNDHLLNNCENATTGTLLVISCNPSYEEPTLLNNPLRMCKDGNWSSSIPQCHSSRVLESCPSLTSSLSTKLKCIYNGHFSNNCENARTGTLLVISCNPSYEEPSLVNNPIRTCIDGKWSSSIPQCYPSRVLGSCPSLTSSLSTKFKCIYNGQLLNNCENATTGTLLVISCNSSYEEPSLLNNPLRMCNDGKWSSFIPQCHPSRVLGSCPSLTSSLSTKLKCIYNGQLLNNCENAKNGTLLVISCNPLYEEPSLQNNPIRMCMDGNWSSSIPQCHSICGRVPSQIIGKNLLFGRKISLTEHNYPWHVGIYKNYGKEYICGGSIIHSKIILTAAHCVTDDVGNHKPMENLLVVAGNYYRNYDDVRDKYSQYSKVAQISTPIGYKGYMLYQASDIAILILDEPFAFSIAVQPVCLALNEESENLKFSLNSTGIATGWGSIKRNGPLSDELKQLTIPYVPFHKCFQEIPETFREYITSDKICGGSVNNGTNICTGDGGGGFIFKNVVEDRYYIKAILSIGLFNNLGECYLNQYSAYTSILHNIEFVKAAIESAL